MFTVLYRIYICIFKKLPVSESAQFKAVLSQSQLHMLVVVFPSQIHSCAFEQALSRFIYK